MENLISVKVNSLETIIGEDIKKKAIALEFTYMKGSILTIHNVKFVHKERGDNFAQDGFIAKIYFDDNHKGKMDVFYPSKCRNTDNPIIYRNYELLKFCLRDDTNKTEYAVEISLDTSEIKVDEIPYIPYTAIYRT